MSKNKNVIIYPDLTSADRPVGHGPGIHVTVPPEAIDDDLQSSLEFNERQPSTDRSNVQQNI